MTKSKATIKQNHRKKKTMPPNTNLPPEMAPEYNDSHTIRTTGSKSSKDGRSQTTQSIMSVSVDRSILEMINTVRDVEQCPEDDALDEASKNCCRRNYHLCCWCCCDIVRGCLIANAIYFCITIFFIVFVAWGAEAMGLEGDVSDDRYQKAIDHYSSGYIIRGFGLVMAIVGSVGAYRLNKWLVGGMVFWYCVYLAWCILGSRYFSVIFAGLLIYPNAALLLALHHEKITPENYEDVKQCCSCLSHKLSEEEQLREDQQTVDNLLRNSFHEGGGV